MSSTAELLDRNHRFAADFADAGLPILPRLRTVILTCGDARVDPAHVLGLELGDAVVIRNNGGRVTPEVIQEIAALTFLVSRMDGDTPGPFELVLMQHTQCGAERFADPQLQRAMKAAIGVDVAPVAIVDHNASLQEDLERLRNARQVPDHVIVSAFLYDVADGIAREVIAPAALRPTAR